MGGDVMRWISVAMLAAVLMCAIPAVAGTITEGETRSVVGDISAIDRAAPSLVVEAPIESGMLTVGVTVSSATVVTRAGAKIGLSDLRTGERVTLTYTRKGNQLIGLEVKAR